MADGKENHYVPKFYLKNFSDVPSADGGRFDFYNLKTRKHIGIIPYGPQMKEAHFYAKESGTESALSEEFEGRHAALLREVLAGNAEPMESELIETALLLLFRTKAKRDDRIAFERLVIDDFVEPFMKSFQRSNPEVAAAVGQHELQRQVREVMYDEYLKETEAAESQIEDFKIISTQAAGLSAEVLSNHTDMNLISSDNPVIQINPYLWRREVPFGQAGLFQMGLVLLLPLDPSTLLVIYDPTIYRSPSAVTRELSLHDVKHVNKLEICLANDGIYSLELPSEIEDLISEAYASRREPKKTKIKFPGGYTMFYDDPGIPDYPFEFLELLPGVNDVPIRVPYSRPGQDPDLAD